MRELDFSFLVPYIPQLVSAAIVTIKLGVLSFVIALCIAVFAGTLRAINVHCLIKLPLVVYVEIFRGTPLLVQLFLIYYGLPSFGIILEPFPAAIWGLSLNCGAYMSEVVRASVQSIERGQYEAAYSLGYSRVQALRCIILPQAFRIALPTFMNYFSTMLKETSIVSVLSIAEITRIGNQIYARTLSPFEIYITLAGFYFVMTYSIALLSKVIERRSTVWTR